jgi:hypothetical protein
MINNNIKVICKHSQDFEYLILENKLPIATKYVEESKILKELLNYKDFLPSSFYLNLLDLFIEPCETIENCEVNPYYFYYFDEESLYSINEFKNLLFNKEYITKIIVNYNSIEIVYNIYKN